MTLSGADVLSTFRKHDALLEGHFLLSSGLHSGGYLQSALVLQYPSEASAFGSALASRVRATSVTTVLSPALGGIVIGHEVARALGVRGIFAERADGRLRLRRGFTLAETDRVLIVEDVLTTGGSTRETMAVARASGASVVAAVAIVDRSGGTSQLDVPFHALAVLDFPTYDPSACSLCAQGIPLVKPGSR